MQIVDAHVHIFERFAGITDDKPITSYEYGKVKIGDEIVQVLPPSYEKSNSTVETLICYMDWCGIEKAVLIPNILYGYHNEYFLTAVKKYSDRLRAVALVDITKGKKAAEQLYKRITNEGFCGLKISTDNAFQCAPETNLDDSKLEPIWECCNELRQPVVLHLSRTRDIKSLITLVDRFRHIRYIVCHMGAEAVHKNSSDINYFDSLLDLVETRKNIYLETSAVPFYYKNEDYPFESSCYIIEKAYKRVGPEKILWGSDYPGMLSLASYFQLINMIIKGCKSILEKHKEMIMGQNAIDLFWNRTNLW
jgi:predicted TIM-barrel fold metal-dependent hydrolase